MKKYEIKKINMECNTSDFINAGGFILNIIFLFINICKLRKNRKSKYIIGSICNGVLAAIIGKSLSDSLLLPEKDNSVE